MNRMLGKIRSLFAAASRLDARVVGILERLRPLGTDFSAAGHAWVSGVPTRTERFWTGLSTTSKKAWGMTATIAAIASVWFAHLQEQRADRQEKAQSGTASQEAEKVPETTAVKSKINVGSPRSAKVPQSPVDAPRQVSIAAAPAEITEVVSTWEPEAPPASPPDAAPPLACPARFIVLSFEKPEPASGVFTTLLDGTQVEVMNCADGKFDTRYNHGLGSIDREGEWNPESIRFQFGYRSDFASDHDVTCEVSGARPGQGSYIGRLNCSSDQSHILTVRVAIEF